MKIGDDANRLAAEVRARVLIDRQLIGARRGRRCRPRILVADS